MLTQFSLSKNDFELRQACLNEILSFWFDGLEI